jgi:hypothetical protein
MYALAAGAIFLLAACNRNALPEETARNTEPEAVTVDIPQPQGQVLPGTTPMDKRVAVIGVLNKRNGIERDLTMHPGQAFRVGDVIVRLRACETTAPWEEQKLTGAFVQVDVRNPQDKFERVFSGWLYKETPSINVVEHQVYDVWPKSCAMTYPEADASTVKVASDSTNRSSAAKSTPAAEKSPSDTSSPGTPAPASTPAGDNAAANNDR